MGVSRLKGKDEDSEGFLIKTASLNSWGLGSYPAWYGSGSLWGGVGLAQG